MLQRGLSHGQWSFDDCCTGCLKQPANAELSAIDIVNLASMSCTDPRGTEEKEEEVGRKISFLFRFKVAEFVKRIGKLSRVRGGVVQGILYQSTR